MGSLKSFLLPSMTFLVLLGVWQGVAMLNIYSEYLFPSPLAVGKGGVELFRSDELFEHVWVSLLRFGAGYGLAALLALPAGLLLGRCFLMWRAIDPLVQVLRPVSPIAWFPLISLVWHRQSPCRRDHLSCSFLSDPVEHRDGCAECPDALFQGGK